MIIYYHKKYNIDLGLLNRLHPFDGLKFKKVFEHIQDCPLIDIKSPSAQISREAIDNYVDSLIKLWLHRKRYILRALELPYIPLLPFSVIDNRILQPMRWGVAGTLEAGRSALQGNNCWNLAGGYHHASHANAEGFCIYNDIGIAVQQLRKQHLLGQEDKILIIDIDAHHGNGNAYTFKKDPNVNILDIYNCNIYPRDNYTKEMLDINIPVYSGTAGPEYLERLHGGLQQLTTGYKLAFVVAGTDVVASDPLGGLRLSVDECVQRDALVLERISALSIPAVFLGGGGYSKDSAVAIGKSISQLYAKF